jgi:hypothetical protein
MSPNAECALNHVRVRAAMHPILNYVEFRTNHEPYMVQGVVHGGFTDNDEVEGNGRHKEGFGQ